MQNHENVRGMGPSSQRVQVVQIVGKSRYGEPLALKPLRTSLIKSLKSLYLSPGKLLYRYFRRKAVLEASGGWFTVTLRAQKLWRWLS